MNQAPMGGTELMSRRINDILPPFVKAGVSLIHGNPNAPLDRNMINIFIAHDLPFDKGIDNYFHHFGFETYDAIVCVSHWQRDLFEEAGYPRKYLHVIENFITPFEPRKSTNNIIPRFIYTSTPHRGLAELVYAVKELRMWTDSFHVDVYSSFKLYGNADADARYATIFAEMDRLPFITNHGTKPNEEIRTALINSDCFIYPSKWHETSCLCLIEAMAAGLECIHTDKSALPETAGGLTTMYRASGNTYSDLVDLGMVKQTASMMLEFIKNPHDNETKKTLMQDRANYVYSPEMAKRKWIRLITELKESKYGKTSVGKKAS